MKFLDGLSPIPPFVPVIKFSQTDLLVSGQYAPPPNARHLYCDLEGNQKEDLSFKLTLIEDRKPDYV